MMKQLSAIFLLGLSTWTQALALDPATVVTHFSFSEERDPIEDDRGLLAGSYYRGQTMVPPKFSEQVGEKGLVFADDTSFLIDPQTLRFGSTELGLALRVFIGKKPPQAQMLAAQQGRFFILLLANGSLLAKIITTEGMVKTTSEGASGRLLVDAWNDVAVFFQHDEVALYLNGQRVGSTQASGLLAGSGNPISLGASLTKAGPLSEGEENQSHFHFEGMIQQFILTNGDMTEEQIWSTE